MNSKDWKVLLAAPLAAFLLSACQHNSDDPEAATGSPYAGLWVSSQTDWDLDQCRRHGGHADRQLQLDAISIQGDGQVVRYYDRASNADPQQRNAYRMGHVEQDGRFRHAGGPPSYGAYANDGTFANFDGTRMILRDMNGSEHAYTRTSETQLEKDQMDMFRCMGYGRTYAQLQPPNGMPPTYAPNVDPRLVRPGQTDPNYNRQVQQPPPQSQQQGPPPPEFRQDRDQPWIQRPAGDPRQN